MWTLRSSLEPFAWCQVVSANFGPGHIFFCQHSHAPHPDRPSPGERRAALSPSLCFMTEAIWQLCYLSLLFFTQGLASSQDQTAHAHAGRRCIEIFFFYSQQDWNHWWRLMEWISVILWPPINKVKAHCYGTKFWTWKSVWTNFHLQTHKISFFCFLRMRSLDDYHSSENLTGIESEEKSIVRIG